MTESTTLPAATARQHPSVALRIGLIAAISIPILNYGTPLVAIPFYPGFNLLTDSTNMLGSDFATIPQIMNIGTLVTAAAVVVGAFGINVALRKSGARFVWNWLATLALLSLSESLIWTAIYHRPDPRQDHNPWAAGLVLLPLLLPIACWCVKNARGLRVYLALNLLLYLAIIPVAAGWISPELGSFGRIVRRCFSVVMYVPPGVIGAVLLRRLKAAA